jgi:DNA-directed RNA polymerase subunit H
MSTKITNSQTISKIFKSRKIFLQQAEDKGFDTSDYNNFSVNEIAVLYTNNQLDLLLKHTKTGKKLYFKYQLLPKLRTNHVYDYIEDLFNIDDVLKQEDDLVIITKERRNDNLTNFLNILYKKEKYFINTYNLNDFMSNILDNDQVPPHRILSDEEKEEIKQKYNILSDKQFPEISRFDPISVIYGIRPGQVFEIIRSSPTSLQTKYYRLCI